MAIGALLVAGTSSDAGKSVLVAGLCRWPGTDTRSFRRAFLADLAARTGRDFTPGLRR